MKYFDRFKANVSHLTSKERVYQMDGNWEGKLVQGSHRKLKSFFKDFSRTFQGPKLFFKDPSWNVMLLV